MAAGADRRAGTETALEVLNINEPMWVTQNVDQRANATAEDLTRAVQFRVVNVDNAVSERHPKIALHVVELRLLMAMRFLEFREADDRL